MWNWLVRFWPQDWRLDAYAAGPNDLPPFKPPRSSLGRNGHHPSLASGVGQRRNEFGPLCVQTLILRAVLSVNLMASEEELKAEIERLRAENEALKKPTRGQISLKVSEKGGLSVYGLGRFPVTLYREQWEKLLGMADEIRNFISENDHALKKKE
jgi:hypothetical protein